MHQVCLYRSGKAFGFVLRHSSFIQRALVSLMLDQTRRDQIAGNPIPSNLKNNAIAYCHFYHLCHQAAGVFFFQRTGGSAGL